MLHCLLLSYIGASVLSKSSPYYLLYYCRLDCTIMRKIRSVSLHAIQRLQQNTTSA